MPRALNPDETFDYQLREDRVWDDDSQRTERTDDKSAFKYEGETDGDKTVFHLTHLSVEQDERVSNRLISSDGSGTINYATGSQLIETLKYGLRGWTRFFDSAGDEVPFKSAGKGHCSNENMNRLSMRHRGELSNAIVSGGVLTVAESD